MSNSYGENLHLTIFGQSHSEAIGMTLEGLPAGLPVDFEALSAFLARRAPGKPIYLNSSAASKTEKPAEHLSAQ